VRSLIALQDTRTPLFTNSAQLATRAGLMALLLGTLDIRAIPTAFALAAVAESMALATVLFVKVQRRLHVPAPAVG
jgi:peptidoglycan biosynthesis protein MviN/MurJ (putative lipid II flippase)